MGNKSAGMLRWFVMNCDTKALIGQGFLTEAEANALAASISASDPYHMYKVVQR